jgi:hypothetical protein
MFVEVTEAVAMGEVPASLPMSKHEDGSQMNLKEYSMKTVSPAGGGVVLAECSGIQDPVVGRLTPVTEAELDLWIDYVNSIPYIKLHNYEDGLARMKELEAENYE